MKELNLNQSLIFVGISNNVFGILNRIHEDFKGFILIPIDAHNEILNVTNELTNNNISFNYVPLGFIHRLDNGKEVRCVGYFRTT